ncbi:hypothetical protein WJX74_005686 [Apatococcus lobatus]|uniref:Uncharacterized protein n=1 Tax=Apatococcus lobatus TaxID=904363 RepID=A0AAW1QBR2_9CHLO
MDLACVALALGVFCVSTGAVPAPPPTLPGIPGRFWSDEKIGRQNDGQWTEKISTSKGLFIDTWKIGVAPITFSVGAETRTSTAIVSLAGRSSDGTWLPALNGTQAATATTWMYATQHNGYTALWGRGQGWVTNLLGAGGNFDDIWTLNSDNLKLPKKSKVTGYRLRTFSHVDDASFEFDQTFAA